MLFLQIMTGVCLYSGIGRYVYRVFKEDTGCFDSDMFIGAIFWPLALPIIGSCYIADTIFEDTNKDK